VSIDSGARAHENHSKRSKNQPLRRIAATARSPQEILLCASQTPYRKLNITLATVVDIGSIVIVKSTPDTLETLGYVKKIDNTARRNKIFEVEILGELEEPLKYYTYKQLLLYEEIK
jgi:hypothetical protein